MKNLCRNIAFKGEDEDLRDAEAFLSKAFGVAVALIGVWPKLADWMKPLVADQLVRRKKWAVALLGAIEREAIPRIALNANQARQILAFKDDSLTEKVTEVWGKLRSERDPQRENVIRKMKRVVQGGKGDPVAGQQVFIELCAQCHKLYDYGADVGPDLTGVGRSDVDLLLSNILDPNLVIGAGYEPVLVETVEGELLTGLVVEDSPQRVVIKAAGGVMTTVMDDQIEEMEYSKLSIMPEGLEEGLNKRAFRDLIALLLTESSPGPWPDVEPVVTVPVGR